MEKDIELKIEELKTVSKQTVEEIGVLMAQLSPNKVFDPMNMKRMMADANARLVVCRNAEGTVVGCAALCIFHTPAGTKATVEEVVVHEAYRGNRIGRRMMEHILKIAETYGPIEVQLTSRPSREAANALYQSLGFEKRETNVYRRLSLITPSQFKP